MKSDSSSKDLPTANRYSNEHTHEIRKLNNYIKTLMDSAIGYSLLLDRDLKIIYHSSNLSRLMRITDDSALIGMPLNEAYKLFDNEGFAEQALCRYSRVVSGEHEFKEDNTVVLPNGEKRIYRIVYRQIINENNDFDGLLVIAHDITNLRLEDAERHLNDLLYSTVLPCLIWDENGIIVAYNSEAVQSFGAPEDLSPEEFNEFFISIQPEFQPDGEETEAIRQRIIQEALGRGFSQSTVRLAKHDGTPIYFMVNAARISWLFNYRLVIYYHDMTDIMIKEAETREAEERIKLMLDCNPLMCVLRDNQGNIIDCNQEALKILGVSNKADFCKNFYSYFPEFQPDGSRSDDKAAEIMQTLDEKGFINLERAFLTPAGEIIPVESRIARIPWKNTYCYISFSRDLREVKANEQKMLEIKERERQAEVQREAAQAANEAKSQFLASMSHEIRTPMNAVLGMSELLLQEKLNKRQLRYVNDIKVSAVALLDIINDILDVSKIQAGKLTLVPVHFDLNVLIDNIASIAQFLLEDKSISFKLSIQDDVPGCLYGDDIRLRQILLNLLGNAIKFTDEGYVHLTVCATNTSVRFSVSDTGIGIQPEDMTRLFEVFEQADMFKNREKKGTGLGLPISRALVEMMGGQVTVESTYGQGTTFHVEIPKIQGDESLIRYADSNEIIINAPDAKILVVDDNVMNLNVACGLLGLCNIEAETALSGAEAIELVRKNEYDIVFMDHMMPEMDGIETTKIIRSLGINVTIIALTASATTGAKEKMLAAGMNDYLSKPIIKNELRHKLNHWIPDEKLLIPPSESDASDESEDEKHEKFWEEIERIEALSTSTGLDRVEGQRDLYRKTLRLMIKEIEKCNTNLNKFLTANDMRNFCIEVHSIKGSLANIGAMELAAKARELEIASGQSDADFCALNLSALLEGLDELGSSIKDAFDLISQRDGSIEIPTELPPILINMMNAFDEIELVIIDKEVEKLNALKLSGALKEVMEPITDAVMMMDYDSASEQIHRLLSSFS